MALAEKSAFCKSTYSMNSNEIMIMKRPRETRFDFNMIYATSTLITNIEDVILREKEIEHLKQLKYYNFIYKFNTKQIHVPVHLPSW